MIAKGKKDIHNTPDVLGSSRRRKRSVRWKLAQNIMFQASRRLPPVARQMRAISASDFLEAAAGNRAAANVNKASKALAISPALRPFLGFAGRALPVIGVAMVLYDLWQFYEFMRTSQYQLNGWILDKKCGNPDVLTGVPDFVNGANCGIGRVFFTKAAWNAAIGVPQNTAGQWQIRGYSDVRNPDATFPTLASAVRKAQWHKPNTEPNLPLPRPMRVAIPANPLFQPPMIWGLDPLSAPIYAPGGFRRNPRLRISWDRRPNPYRAREYDYRAEYTLPGFPVYGEPAGLLDRVAPPLVLGATSARVGSLREFGAKHALARPPSFVKERKARIPTGYQAVAFLMNGLTESADAINAVYDALPAKFKDKRLGQKFGEARKLALLYRHWGEVDLVQAVQNLIVNQIEDVVIGKLGNRLKRHAQANHPHGMLPFGYQIGPAL